MSDQPRAWPWPPSRISGVFQCPLCWALVQMESMPAHLDAAHPESADLNDAQEGTP